ncbi:MAG TPA: glycoside hydrolase family 3 N-terminal domain-containing protein [Gaiellales bacterium]|nr:glycoside hydrolase family 3 N-terminal domain-containing protein [Gaiellales bacterium]
MPSLFPALAAFLAFLAHLVSAPAPAPPPLSELIGQKLVVRIDGRRPDPGILGRIRLGRVGGVILYRGRNFTTPGGLRSIAAALQAAAADGGRPPLLIAVDQEGGAVKQVPWAPPALSPPQLGAAGSAARALAQGAATGAALHRLGVNADFAPVADVPASPRSFMLRAGRTWSGSAAVTSALANAFASGLERGGVVPVMKHFPGLGYADLNTDSHVEAIAASRSRLDPGLAPYRRAIARRIPMIMLSNAIYDAYDGASAAGWSGAIGTRLLRRDLGFTGVTITDSLDGAAHARGIDDVPLALRAARAGTDMILVTGSEATSLGVYRSLVAAARRGELSRAQLEASSRRIRALKRTL